MYSNSFKTETSVKTEPVETEKDPNYGYETYCGCGCKFCHDNEFNDGYCGSSSCRETDDRGFDW